MWGAYIFQPTRPLRGATCFVKKQCLCCFGFQPTRPLRGATIVRIRSLKAKGFQPTRPLRGATSYISEDCGGGVFQPTRPLRGATKLLELNMAREQFQPTRPLRGATCSRLAFADQLNISTHAPLAGRDKFKMVIYTVLNDFNPRAPCGARP